MYDLRIYDVIKNGIVVNFKSIFNINIIILILFCCRTIKH